ncbi:hypothetical protein [Streptomyces sp. NPDC052114]|uniref:hypothetical protein n=1 Tax=unclassified Streptomyces TaxID=2593676 RepID=UPI0034146AA8
MKHADHYAAEAERLLKAVTTDTGAIVIDEGTAEVLAAAQAHATLALAATQSAPAPAVLLETEPAVAYVYRAAWNTSPLGTYTNAEAARMHCEADAINHNPEFGSGRVFDWLGDESEPGDPYELVVATQGGRGVEKETEYTVTRVEVASEYDAEADQ